MGQFYLISFMASLTLFFCFALVIISDYRILKGVLFSLFMVAVTFLVI